MGARKASLSTTIGLGLFVLALAPILVLALAGGRLVNLRMEETLETSIMVEARLAAKEAAWGRASVITVLDSMALFPPGKDPELANFLSKGGARRVRVDFTARLDPEGRPELLWPPERAVAVADAVSRLSLRDPKEEGSAPEAVSWSEPRPDGRGGDLLVGFRRGSWGTDLAALNLGVLRDYLSAICLSEADCVALFDEEGRVIARSQSTAIPQGGLAPGIRRPEGHGTKLRSGGRTFTAYSVAVPDSPWVAVYYRDGGFLSPFYAHLFLRLGGAAAAAVILALVLGLRIRREIAAPFTDIIAKMRAVAKGHYDLRVMGDYPMELTEIAEAFNLMAENVGIRDREVQESQDRYRSLFHDNPVPALLIEPESGVIRGANPAASDFYGYSLEELETVTIQGISALSAADMLAEAAEAKHEGRKHYSLRHRMKNGSIRDVEVYSNPIVLGGKGYHYVLIFDVTARRVAQDQLEKALEEKVVLLKEIHHRVKNNLQIVASLLNLQIRYIKDPEDRELFKTSQNRVYSMSLTHELLYQAADLSSINMGEYGQRLISYLREAHQQSELRILTEFGHFMLPLDKALPCGLILNELVTNAIKYASPAQGEDPVKVTMSLHSEARGRLVLVEVMDHGPGIPPGMDPLSSSSLGFSLISSLSHQLEGKVEWTAAKPGAAKPGTRARLTFPFESTAGDTLSRTD